VGKFPGERELLPKGDQSLLPLGCEAGLERLRKRAGLERASPYMLRHTAATSYLREGADLETIRLLLDHSIYAVTHRYLRLTQGDLAKVQRRASLMLRLK